MDSGTVWGLLWLFAMAVVSRRAPRSALHMLLWTGGAVRTGLSLSDGLERFGGLNKDFVFLEAGRRDEEEIEATDENRRIVV